MSLRPVTELRTDVLRYLNVLASGQNASAEDAQLVDDAIVDVLAMLDEEGLTPWDATLGIPRPAYRPLVRIVANTLVGDFGKQAEAQYYDAMSTQGVAQLRRQKELPYVPSTVRVDYF